MSKTIELEIKDINGLHARKCLSICKTASNFISKLLLTHNGHTVDIKSILGLLSLACPYGSKIIINADGQDAEKAISTLQQIVC